jgi:hypothetical protein
MSTIQLKFDTYAIERLKLRMYDVTQFVVLNKPDCAKLSELITSSGYGYVSVSTLYRLFFQSEQHLPYKNTLDILCRFIGYHDCMDFLDDINKHRETMYQSGIQVGSQENSLLYYAIENKAEKTLSDFFEGVSDSSDDFKTSLSIALYDSLVQATYPEKFLKKFSQNKFVREYFFEKAHDPKFRIKNYEESYQYYLKHVKQDRSIADFQDFIFANCVLFRHQFLVGNYTNAIITGNKLYTTDFRIEELQNDIYIFPFIRYIAYKLWYLQLQQESKSIQYDYATYLIELGKKLKPSLGNAEQRILFHTIAETFANSNIPVSYHDGLKEIYRKDFEKFPAIIMNKHIKYSLPYFEENGLLRHRP